MISSLYPSVHFVSSPSTCSPKNITFTPVSNFTITRFMSSAFLQLYHSLLFFCLSCQSIHPSPSKLSGRSWKDDTVWWRIYITVTKYILNVFLSACCCQTYTVCCGSFCVLLAGSKGYFTDTISDIKKQTMKPHSPFLFRCFCFTWNASWFHKKKKKLPLQGKCEWITESCIWPAPDDLHVV